MRRPSRSGRAALDARHPAQPRGREHGGTGARSERPARFVYSAAAPAHADLARALAVGVSVGAPVVVEGRLWGVIQAGWSGEESPPADTEARLARFAELLETAIANADSRDQLTASRARLLTEARRGAPPRGAGPSRRRAAAAGAHDHHAHARTPALREEDGDVEELLAEALQHAQQGTAELRELAHGILPAALTHGGLRAGVDAVAARLDLPVRSRCPGAAVPGGDRTKCVLHRRRVAHEHRQVRGRSAGRGQGARG